MQEKSFFPRIGKNSAAFIDIAHLISSVAPSQTTKVTEHYRVRNSIKTMSYFEKSLEMTSIENWAYI